MEYNKSTHKLNCANDMNDSYGTIVPLCARLTSTEFTHTHTCYTFIYAQANVYMDITSQTDHIQLCSIESNYTIFTRTHIRTYRYTGTQMRLILKFLMMCFLCGIKCVMCKVCIIIIISHYVSMCNCTHVQLIMKF